MAVTATKIRSGRAAQLLLAFQTAKGTIVDNFTTAARIWSELVGVPISPEKSKIEDDLKTLGPKTAASFNEEEIPRDELRVLGTPESVEYFLRSNFGSFAGGAFTLVEQIAATQYLTLAWVENTAAGATEKLLRIRDVWIGRLEFVMDNLGRLVMIGDYGGTVIAAPVALDALGGVTLPAAPMAPADLNPFQVRSATLVRDPAGLNVSIRLDRLSILFDQGMEHEPDDMKGGEYSIFKSGPLWVDVTFEAVASDETWAILTDSRAATKRRFRITAAAASPAKTLTFDFYETDFKVLPLGHEARDYHPFRATGRAHVDGSGNFVAITLV